MKYGWQMDKEDVLKLHPHAVVSMHPFSGDLWYVQVSPEGGRAIGRGETIEDAWHSARKNLNASHGKPLDPEKVERLYQTIHNTMEPAESYDPCLTGYRYVRACDYDHLLALYREAVARKCRPYSEVRDERKQLGATKDSE